MHGAIDHQLSTAASCAMARRLFHPHCPVPTLAKTQGGCCDKFQLPNLVHLIDEWGDQLIMIFLGFLIFPLAVCSIHTELTRLLHDQSRSTRRSVIEIVHFSTYIKLERKMCMTLRSRSRLLQYVSYKLLHSPWVFAICPGSPLRIRLCTDSSHR